MKATISIGSRTPRVDVPSLCLHESNTIEDAVVRIDRSRRVSIALVVDDHDRLINTLSDGDVRRGIMAGLKLSDTINKLLQIKARTPHPLPVTALAGTEDDALLELMQMRGVRQIPLVTPQGRAVDIVTLGDLVPDVPHALQAVVMAGGEGRRLRPPGCPRAVRQVNHPPVRLPRTPLRNRPWTKSSCPPSSAPRSAF